MEGLADSWVLWLVLTIITIAGLVFRRKNTPGAGHLYHSSEDFSIRHILFGFSRGEGDLFLGYCFAILFAALFFIGFVRWIQHIS
ncbi:MAG: hypothetical protein OEW39_10825 [Deltaproteobacteria bacterium]|nr:hypothetical protein [Deltaproteobacteria bacterium]